MPIKIAGRISTTIVLQDLPDLVADIDFHVLQKDHCSLDLIIGRDFFKNNSISVLYSPSNRDLESKVLLFQEIASTEIVTERANEPYSPTLTNIKTDFDSSVKEQLISTILEVENIQ